MSGVLHWALAPSQIGRTGKPTRTGDTPSPCGWFPLARSASAWFSSFLTPAELLKPCDPLPMMAYPVDRRVNTPAQDDPALIEPWSAAAPNDWAPGHD
jgi:hypothetical protein